MGYKFTAKRIIKGAVSPVLDFCGVYDSMLAKRVFAQPNWLILMYHRVVESAKEDPFRLGMCIGADVFEAQIEYHTRNFTPITVADAIARIRAGKPLPHHAVSVTFDDGYLDFRNVALPILKRYQCPATVYVTTGGLESEATFWWDRITDAIARTRARSVDIRFLAPGAEISEVSLAPRHRRESLALLQRLFWEQPPERLEAYVEQLREQLGVADSLVLKAPRMRHADIAALGREDVEIGAHCEQHFDMRRLTPHQCLHELETSRRQLQEISGQPVNGFAYPGGRENSRVRNLVAHAGFTYAAGTIRGLNRQPYDTYSLRRIGMPDARVSEYKRCLAMAASSATEHVPLMNESVPWL